AGSCGASAISGSPPSMIGLEGGEPEIADAPREPAIKERLLRRPEVDARGAVDEIAEHRELGLRGLRHEPVAVIPCAARCSRRNGRRRAHDDLPAGALMTTGAPLAAEDDV